MNDNMSPSILADLLDGRFVAEQYLGLAFIGAILAFGIWQHVKDTRDEGRRRR